MLNVRLFKLIGGYSVARFKSAYKVAGRRKAQHFRDLRYAVVAGNEHTLSFVYSDVVDVLVKAHAHDFFKRARKVAVTHVAFFRKLGFVNIGIIAHY